VKNKIKHQMEILPFGGTDAMGMPAVRPGDGVHVVRAARYVHSPNRDHPKNKKGRS